jgi:hypothetical protein
MKHTDPAAIAGHDQLLPMTHRPVGGTRRQVLKTTAAALAGLAAFGPGGARASGISPADVLLAWYKLAVALVRHTPTYSPPVASRTFAYVGVTVFEAVASGSDKLQSLAGQLHALTPVPQREVGKTYDDSVVLNAALAQSVRNFFNHTGPTGQRVIAGLGAKLQTQVSDGVPGDILARSQSYGEAVAAHILAWSQDDGGADIENMGFPLEYHLTPGPAHWVPTSLIAQQQAPLLPYWGKTRTFAMPEGSSCGLPSPPEYSEDKSSEFYRQALEVYETGKTLTDEQRTIARFWSDDPMLSPTPPGHWISIAFQIFERNKVGLDKQVETLARLGVVLADSFIGCWDAKFRYDLLRPVTYIHRVIDPKWEPLLITPPFPEYPSGHSTQSAAAAEVMTGQFGENCAFTDMTRKGDGLKPRNFASFKAAADEAGISRLYGGIHFRAAIERGLDQGRCIAAFTNALRMRR